MNKLPEASSTKAGIITTGTQTVAGDKTVVGTLTLQNSTGNTLILTKSNDAPSLKLEGGSGNDYSIDLNTGTLRIYNDSATPTATVTQAGSWTFGPSSGSALTHKFQSGGQTVVQSESTTGHAFLRISSAASSDAQLDFLESTTTRWSMFNRGSTDNFELTCSAGGVLLVTQAGNWTIGPTNYTGTHALNGNLNVKKNGSGNALVVTEQSTGEVELVLQRTAGTTASWEMYIPSGATTLNWWVGGNRMILDTSGNLSITGSLSQSDSRYKNIQGTLTNALSGLDTITPVYYTWIDGYGYDERTHIGLLAQEVEQVFPELVFDQDDIKRLNYGNFCAVLVTAIKELKARVEALENA